MIGYDFDDVITSGITPVRDSVIITGRSFEEAPEVNYYLKEKGIFNPVYYSPHRVGDTLPKNSAKWKVRMLKLLKVDTFYEDDIEQIEIIEECLPNLEIIQIK